MYTCECLRLCMREQTAHDSSRCINHTDMSSQHKSNALCVMQASDCILAQVDGTYMDNRRQHICYYEAAFLYSSYKDKGMMNIDLMRGIYIYLKHDKDNYTCMHCYLTVQRK